MVDAGLERYRTSRHEAIHALSALHSGHGVSSIDVDQGETVLSWAYSHHELTALVHRDRAHAIHIVTGVVAACVAPAADERGPVNEGDRAVVDKWRAAWTCTTPTWADLYCQAGRLVRAWLREPTTAIAIGRLTVALYAADGPVEGARLEQLLRQATAPAVQTTTPQPYSTHIERNIYVGSTHRDRGRAPYSRINPRFFVAGATR